VDVLHLPVTLDDGTETTLAELCRSEALALIFLRHFGCVFCRYQVAQLRSEPDLPLCFVCQETWEEAAEFKKKMRSPHRFISDPERVIYRHFEIPRGKTRELLSLKTLLGAMKAMLSGSFQGKPTADPTQLGGVVILSRDGTVYWKHPAADASEIVTAITLRGILQEEFAVVGED
jgi:hypothetical protein